MHIAAAYDRGGVRTYVVEDDDGNQHGYQWGLPTEELLYEMGPIDPTAPLAQPGIPPVHIPLTMEEWDAMVEGELLIAVTHDVGLETVDPVAPPLAAEGMTLSELAQARVARAQYGSKGHAERLAKNVEKASTMLFQPPAPNVRTND